MEKFYRMYVMFFVMTLSGFFAIGCFRPEQLTLANCISLFYIFHFSVFFRVGVDNVEEKPLYGIACWLVILAAIISILCGANFWFVPLISVLVVVLYFFGRAYLYHKYLNKQSLLENSVSILALSYIVNAIVQFVF